MLTLTALIVTHVGCYLKECSAWFRASSSLSSGHALALSSPLTSEFPTTTYHLVLLSQATLCDDSPQMSAEKLWRLSRRSLHSIYFLGSLTQSWYVNWILLCNHKPHLGLFAVSPIVCVPAVCLHGDLCGSCTAESCCLCQHDLLLCLQSVSGSSSDVCYTDGFVR